MNSKPGPEGIVLEIKRRTRRKYNADERIRIVLEGLKGDASIAELCRREGIIPTCILPGLRSFWRRARNASRGIASGRPRRWKLRA
jgi:transposase